MNGRPNTTVAEVFAGYPTTMGRNLTRLRRLILETAAENDLGDQLQETLKWGEPSYLVKDGSTIRVAWREAKPDQYAMYFNCRTKLVFTFKDLYDDVFAFDGNRAIVFQADDKIPVRELKHCILLALTYHKRKRLPRLGA